MSSPFRDDWGEPIESPIEAPYFPTPDSIPLTNRERLLVIPDDPVILSAVNATLIRLANPAFWFESGSVTRQEIADRMWEMLETYWSEEVSSMTPRYEALATIPLMKDTLSYNIDLSTYDHDSFRLEFRYHKTYNVGVISSKIYLQLGNVITPHYDSNGMSPYWPLSGGAALWAEGFFNNQQKWLIGAVEASSIATVAIFLDVDLFNIRRVWEYGQPQFRSIGSSSLSASSNGYVSHRSGVLHSLTDNTINDMTITFESLPIHGTIQLIGVNDA